MGGGGKKRGGGIRKVAKGGGRRAQRAGKRVGHQSRVGIRKAGKVGRSGLRGAARCTRAGLKASRHASRRAFRATSRMATRSHGMHFRWPGIKQRKFSFHMPKLGIPKLQFSKSIHHSRHHRSSVCSLDDDTYHYNSSLGYHSYDDINSYSHRRYARAHGYKPIVNKDSLNDVVTYDSLRVTLPPDSPNFCFIPLTTMSMCGSADEKEAAKAENFDPISKVIALLSRPYNIDGSSMTSLYSAARDLLNTSGTLLRGMDDPEDNGWYIPDFLCYGCIVGKSKQQRMDEFVEKEMEETADEIVVLWHKHAMISARGITVSFVDIGNIFCGFAFEVLPYINEPSAVVNGGGKMISNPQFFAPPSAPPLNVSPAELKTMQYISESMRGHRIEEAEYDAAFQEASSELNNNEIVATENYAQFLVIVPDGLLAGGFIAAQSPDGLLYSICIPEGASPGSTLLVEPGNFEQSDVVTTVFTTTDFAGDPPSYAESFYHCNVSIGSESDSLLPPYSTYELSSAPPLPSPSEK